MCQAFSCLVMPDCDVKWEFAMDSHNELIEKFNLKDDTADKDALRFARAEIVPKNGNYLKPDKWILVIDESIKPSWWTDEHARAALKAHKQWLRKLRRYLRPKTIINPFTIKPPARITTRHLALLKEWASVWASVRASVRDSVRDSVWASVRDSVRASVWASVGDSVWDSVWASVRASVRVSVGVSVWASVQAYTGSFFKLPRKAWTYTENIKTKGYPFQSLVDLWEVGLIPSYDGKVWRLHGGKDAKVLWSGTLNKEER